MNAVADAYREFPCDLCGSADAVEVPHCREFFKDGAIHICCRCGFVYARRRRTAQRIAEVWSDDIFGRAYTAAIPAVRARLTYVAEFVGSAIGLRGKTVCEIGAGEGHGLDLLREPRYGATVFGIEPSRANGERLRAAAIEHFTGTIEEFLERPDAASRFDIVTIQWTLENCEDCRAMLSGANQLLKPGGAVVVATGSRILVPFKKPLHTYFSGLPADTHAFRFSANTLHALLTVSGFDVAHVNRYIDHDVLCQIGVKTADANRGRPWRGDPYLDVYNFFERWYVDTKMYYPDPVG
jgi:2-polyprenyl-3-methyl-5-hydroxy-6-metoxy-1,4-benzoquinol methylase